MTAAKMHAGPIASWGLDSVYAVGFEAAGRVPGHGSKSHYRDEGCDLAPKCVECPFPRCMKESGPGRYRKGLLAASRIAALTEAGMSVAEIMAATGLSKRQVFRYKRTAKERTAP